MPQAPEQSIVTIEKLVYGGDGLARQQGRVVLVPFVLPGERVAIAPERANASLLRGSLLHVLDAAPARISPRCEYFGNCGGCHYQQIAYDYQLQQKREILRETLQRLAGFTPQTGIEIISGEPWFYRNRIQLHFAGPALGFHRRGSHELCSIRHCEISSPALNRAIAALQAAVRSPHWPSFLRSIELFTNETDLQINIGASDRPLGKRFFDCCRKILPSLAGDAIAYQAAGFTLRVSRGTFFQVNRFLIDALVREVLADMEGRYALDLYAGAGLFSLPLATRFSRVRAVERGASAYSDLESNARQAENLQLAKSSAEEFLASEHEAPDAVIADPPRAGLGTTVVEHLLRLRPRRLTIVSCDISTLARDLRKLLSTYRVRRLTMADLFPQTYHLEAVIHLEAAGG
jgi:23S rRNA (uracil1939-C5)-methyltransferase